MSKLEVQKYVKLYGVKSFSFAKGQQVRITQKEHLLVWNSETTQNLNIYK